MEPTLNQVIAWAKAAGKVALDGLHSTHTIGYKGETDFVTEVDHACEKLLLDAILGIFPEHSIIAEETGKVKGHPDHCWHIDPLDGTINYSHKVPFFAISVAYQYQGKLQLGVVYDPSHDECFSAERGKGAWLNGEPIRVSDCPDIQHSLLVTGLPHNEPDQALVARRMEIFGRMTNITQGVRRLGSAAIDICYVACGRLDGYWEEKINSWDIAAGSLISQEAGATVTDLHGDPDYFKPPYGLVSSAPGIHSNLLKNLQ
ncbi:MAG: inositol monophosphatase [Chloroflexi bacterium HGW-Chloroflexi-4]|jgi:myo-inositol-1(or 4)-monophosphatase|nr:MAG: inositol monophosphatase [Chloroflexi bacterium HGW-Chloroflexi-4]